MPFFQYIRQFVTRFVVARSEQAAVAETHGDAVGCGCSDSPTAGATHAGGIGRRRQQKSGKARQPSPALVEELVFGLSVDKLVEQSFGHGGRLAVKLVATDPPWWPVRKSAYGIDVADR